MEKPEYREMKQKLQKKDLLGPQLIKELNIHIRSMSCGAFEGITDVEGVWVGHVSIIRGDEKNPPVIRTGITAILPHNENIFQKKVTAGVHVINGFTKCVGLLQVRELGELESPILLTGSLNVWRVADAMIDILSKENPKVYSFNPVVCECNDSFLNESLVRPVQKKHVMEAVSNAGSGPVPEGSVGAGVGMSAFGFKSGIGTASRILSPEMGGYTIGVIVLMNTGTPGELRIDGIPVGREIHRKRGMDKEEKILAHELKKVGNYGSVIVIVATDAPLSSRQLTRIARRTVVGLARVGAMVPHGSGDTAIAFTTFGDRNITEREHVTDRELTLFFKATIEATEEAVLRSILTAETLQGRDGRIVKEILWEDVKQIVDRYR